MKNDDGFAKLQNALQELIVKWVLEAGNQLMLLIRRKLGIY